jgi:hypothetical protein
MRVPEPWRRREDRDRRRPPVASRQLLSAAVVVALALLAGCSINEQKSADNKDKKVEIKTPFGDLKVNTEVDPRDTGLPVYPGARRAPKDEHDSNAANVNISTGAFGLKVVAVKFESDDPPDKVLAFYRDKVKAYGGKYLECRGMDIDFHGDRNDDSSEISCGKGDAHGDSTELKAGTPDRQHIVSVKPHGSGSEFALVYVNKRGKEGEL